MRRVRVVRMSSRAEHSAAVVRCGVRLNDARRSLSMHGVCLLPFLFSSVNAQLNMRLFNNTAFGMPVVATASLRDLSGGIAVESLQSAEILGQVAMPTDGGTVVFSAVSDGTVRVWVDDHLVLDDAVSTAPPTPRTIASWITFPQHYPPTGGGASVLIRVEYTRPSGGTHEGILQLEWTTAVNGSDVSRGVHSRDIPSPGPVPVPASAFSPTLSAPQLEREALRRRLYEPIVPWQTYASSSMTAHTLCPTGFVLRFTVGNPVCFLTCHSLH